MKRKNNRSSNLKIKWAQKLISLLRSDDGASFAEYGLLVTLIAIVCYLGVSAFGGGVSQLFEDPRIETYLTGN